MRFLLTIICISALFSREKTSIHSLNLDDEFLNYTVSISTGEISSISYTKDTEENRPITFAFNGGPGSASLWLHLGSFGPRRVLTHEEGQNSFPPYQLVDNLETILDVTDIVFIDPTGTGLSSTPEESTSYSVSGDIEAVGIFIRDYLTKNRRWNSPKYIAGESYGAIRAAGLAEYLQNQFSIYPNGLILISAAIDLQTRIFQKDNPLPYFLFLPTYAATAHYHGLLPNQDLSEVIRKAKDFAYTTYASSLICRHCHSHDPIYEKLSQLTSLPLSLIKQHKGRISDTLFIKELLRDKEQKIGRMDARITGHPSSRDPSIHSIENLFSNAFHDYLHNDLDWQNSYTLFSANVNQKWDFFDYNEGWGYPNLMTGLRNALSQNPQMKIFVGCGIYDLATPFATVEYCFDHLEIPDVSIQMEYYEGGHMYYLNPSARKKFKQDLSRFYQNLTNINQEISPPCAH